MLRRLVVTANGDHDGVVIGNPNGEHPVLSIEVPAADVLQHPAAEPVAGRLAAAV